LLASASDISDGGITVALAEATFAYGIGATVEQEPSLMAHPIFGLFAETSSTVMISTHPSNTGQIESIAHHFGFIAARIGTTGGKRVQISLYGEPAIDTTIDELRKPWSTSLEATLHDEVHA
jgi:phosphoribosylformylglycinamidine synthase